MFIQREVLTKIFAPVIWACVEQYNCIEEKTEPVDILKQKMKTTINETLRYWEEEQPKMVSMGAIDLANDFNKKNYTNHDITKIKYTNRNILGGEKSKPNLMFDHTTPVKETVDELIKCNSLIEVENILNSTSEICIITRNEDKDLNKKIDGKSYKNERPNGWEKCYSERGIEISYRPK